MAKAAQRSLLVLDGAAISPLEQVKERPGCYGTWETLCTGVCGVLNQCRESSPKEQVKRLRVVADQGFAREMQLLIPANKDYVFCNTPKLVDWAYDQIEKATDISFDIETTHPTAGGDDRIEEDFRNVPIGWSFSWADHVAAYMPLYTNDEREMFWADKKVFDHIVERGKKVLENPNIWLHGQNLKFDAKNVRRTFGIHLLNIYSDTMLEHHLLDENRAFSSHGLDDMASKFLHPVFAKYYEVLKRALDFYDPKLRRYSKVPPEVIWPYACSDADATRLLALLFERMLKSEGKLLDLYNSIVRPLSQVIIEMEMTGLDIDNERVQANITNLGQQITKLEIEAKQLAGVEFDLSSPEQLAHVLFEVLKLKGGKRGKTGFSTDKEVLAKLQDQHPVVRLAQEHRKLIKLRGTYVEGLHRRLIEGRYYPPWNQNGTISGRFSTELVNLLPREEHGGGMIKGQFKAPEGFVLLFRDLSQIELRMGAHVSQDAFMLDGYRNGGRDFDLHAKTAAGVFKNKVIAPAGWDKPHDFSWVKTYFKKYRSISKNINFLTAYGGGPDRLMELVNSDYPEEAITKEEAESFIADYFKVMTGLAAAIKECHIFLQKNGYVESLFGRRRRLPDGQIVTWDRNVPYSRPDCYGRDSPRLHSQLGVPAEEIPGMVNNFPAQNALVTVRAYNDRMRNKTTGVGPFDKCVKGPHDPNWFCSFLPICLIEKERRSRTHIIGEAQRQAFNFLLQSAAGDYTNLSLVKIWAEIRKNNLQSRPVLQIHDALGFLVPYHEVDYMLWLTRDRMENAYPLSLPITSEAGVAKYWGEEDNKIPKECKACKAKLQVGETGVEQLGEWSRFTQYESRCDKCNRVEQIRVFATGDHLA